MQFYSGVILGLKRLASLWIFGAEVGMWFLVILSTLNFAPNILDTLTAHHLEYVCVIIP